MDTVADRAFVRALPKAELHLHIEGSLEPELMFALAQRNAVAIPFASVAEVRAAYNFSCLQDFLDIYYQGMSVLRTEQDFFDLTMAYFARMADDGVTHTEIFFDPQGHTSRGVAFATVVGGIARAMKQAEEQYLISSCLIMCFLRHLSEEDAIATLNAAAPFKALIAGVGLDSSEKGHPPTKFERVYALARDLGFKAVAHAGEEGPAQNIEDSMSKLHVCRIDHGVSARESEPLMAKLGENQMGLTMCPLSNLKLQATPDLKQHPCKMFLAKGMCVSLNSDDPAYFGGYMVDNYMAMVDAQGLTRREVAQVALNSFSSSWLPDAAKAVYAQRIRNICDVAASASSAAKN